MKLTVSHSKQCSGVIFSTKKMSLASRLGRSDRSDVNKAHKLKARIMAHCDATGERGPCIDQVPPKSGKRGKLVTARAAQGLLLKTALKDC